MKSDKISTPHLSRFSLKFRKHQQASSLGFKPPPRIGLKGTDELCMSKTAALQLIESTRFPTCKNFLNGNKCNLLRPQTCQIMHSSVNNFNINNKTIYSKQFLDTCFGLIPKMKVWNQQIQKYGTIGMDQEIEEKAEKTTNFQWIRRLQSYNNFIGILFYYCRLPFLFFF